MAASGVGCSRRAIAAACTSSTPSLGRLVFVLAVVWVGQVGEITAQSCTPSGCAASLSFPLAGCMGAATQVCSPLTSMFVAPSGTVPVPVDATVSEPIAAVATGDLNRDGSPDVVSARGGALEVVVQLLPAAPTTTAAAVNATTQRLAHPEFDVALLRVVKFDGDEWLDVVTVSHTGRSMSWYRNEAGTGFSNVIRSLVNTDIVDLAFGDVDDDGRPDVFILEDSQVRWFHNVDGSATLQEKALVTQDIEDFQDDALAVLAVSLDGDTDTDCVVAYADRIVWFINEPTGVFEQKVTLSDSAIVTSARWLAPGDVDADGDIDLVVLQSVAGDTILWLENLPVEAEDEFVTHVIGAAAPTTTVSQLRVLDMDTDGTVDVVFVTDDDYTLNVFVNVDGAGSFSTSSAPLVTTAAPIVAYELIDVDGDADVEFVVHDEVWDNAACASTTGSCFTSSYFSDPAAQCVRQLDDPAAVCDDCSATAAASCLDTEFARGCAGTSNGTCTACSVAVCDAGTYLAAGCSATNDAVCTECCAPGSWATGCGAFDDGNCTACDAGACNITEALVGCGTASPGVCSRCAPLTDSCAPSGYPVQACGFGSTWECDVLGRMISTTDRNVVPQSLHLQSPESAVLVLDLLGDGSTRPDILVADNAGGTITLFRTAPNSSLPSPADMFADNPLVIAAFDDPWSVAVADLGIDGRLDIVVGTSGSDFNDRALWIHNRGTRFSGAHTIWQARGPILVVTADMNGDGHLDVLAAAASDDLICWFEALPVADGYIDRTCHPVLDVNRLAPNAPVGLIAADITGDGLPDVVVASTFDNRVTYYPNRLGNGTFRTLVDVDILSDGARATAVQDLDQDGDLDIVVASFLSQSVAWIENVAVGADGTITWIKHTLSTRLAFPTAVLVVDLNRDHLFDLLVIQNAQVVWFSGDGAGGFVGPTVLVTAATGIRTAVVSDLDDDGDDDVLLLARAESGMPLSVITNGACHAQCPTNWFSAGVCVRRDETVDSACNECDASVCDLSDQYLAGCGPLGPGTCEFCDDPHTCPFEMYETEACSNVTNHVCTTCPFDVCGPDQGLAGCGSTSNGTCRDCNATATLTCDSDEYLAGCGAVSGGRLGQCELCSTPESCPDGTYQTEPCSLLADRVCSPCCADGFWGDGCAGINPGTCVACDASPCLLSEFLLGCRKTSPGTCVECPSVPDACHWDSYPVQSCYGLNAWQCEGNLNLVSFADDVIPATLTADVVLGTAVGDLDGDSIADVLVSFDKDVDNLVWYRNIGGDGVFGGRAVIASVDSRVVDMAVGDWDGDGATDVCVSPSSTLGVLVPYYRNGGSWTPVVQFGSFEGLNLLTSADMDGDGWMDMVATGVLFGGRLRFFRNTQSVARDAFQFAAVNVVVGALPLPSQLRAIDVDADGDLDLVVLTFAGAQWFQHSAETASRPWQRVYMEMPVERDLAIMPYTVHGADMDADGLLDLVMASHEPTMVWWFRNANTTNANNRFVEVVEVSRDGTTALTVADMDMDGLTDVVVVSTNYSAVGWYKSLANDSTYPLQATDTSVSHGMELLAVNLDADPDTDFLVRDVGDPRGVMPGIVTMRNYLCRPDVCPPGFFKPDTCLRRADVSGVACAPVTPTPTPTPSGTPSMTPTSTQTPSQTPSKSRRPTRSPTSSRTSSPTAMSSQSLSHTATRTSSQTSSQTPSRSATSSHTPTSSVTPSVTPSVSTSAFAAHSTTFTRALTFPNIDFHRVARAASDVGQHVVADAYTGVIEDGAAPQHLSDALAEDVAAFFSLPGPHHVRVHRLRPGIVFDFDIVIPPPAALSADLRSSQGLQLLHKAMSDLMAEWDAAVTAGSVWFTSLEEAVPDTMMVDPDAATGATGAYAAADPYNTSDTPFPLIPVLVAVGIVGLFVLACVYKAIRYCWQSYRSRQPSFDADEDGIPSPPKKKKEREARSKSHFPRANFRPRTYPKPGEYQ